MPLAAQVQCRSWEEAEALIAALQAQVATLAHRVRYTEKQLDTLGTPWWRRVLFRLDGWPPWWVVADRRAWRPWHRRAR